MNFRQRGRNSQPRRDWNISTRNMRLDKNFFVFQLKDETAGFLFFFYWRRLKKRMKLKWITPAVIIHCLVGTTKLLASSKQLWSPFRKRRPSKMTSESELLIRKAVSITGNDTWNLNCFQWKEEEKKKMSSRILCRPIYMAATYFYVGITVVILSSHVWGFPINLFLSAPLSNVHRHIPATYFSHLFCLF